MKEFMNTISKYIALGTAALLAGFGLSAQDYGTGAVSTATGDDLYKSVEANLSNTFVGNFTGMTVKHGSGEPGAGDALWLIRGMGSYGLGSWSQAKIFVDGFEVNAEYMTSISAAEIEKVEVLKDAAALVLYGERGANGIIRITTRRGAAGKASVNARVRTGVQTPALLLKPLGAGEYARLYNQAVSNDNGMMWSPVYDQLALDTWDSGQGTDVDWYGETLRKAGWFVDTDIIVSGGSKDARYNINLDYLGNQGLLNTRNTDVTRNIGYNRFNVRANLDFNILKIFEVKVDIGGRIELLHRSNYNISNLFRDLSRYPANVYPVYDNEALDHLSGTAVFPNNPYGSVNALGWQSYKGRSLQTNLSVRERLDMLTEGLWMEEAVSFYSYTLSAYSKTRNYARWYGGNTTTTDETTTITASGYGSNGMQDWKQGRVSLGYDRIFGAHNLSANVNWGISAYKGDGYFSYKYNTMNLYGVLHYDYGHRYILEAGFSEFGNDAYAKGNRWAFYPAVSAAWVLSNETFLKDSDAVQLLKLRASAGMSGFSDSGVTSVLSGYDSNGRYLFKDYYTASYIGAFYTGQSQGTWQSTLVPMFNPNPDVHAEKSLKINAGLDAKLWKCLSISADAFLDKRSDILTLDRSIPAYLGKQYSFANIGKMTSWGAELEIRYAAQAGDWGWEITGNGAFNRNRIDYMAEIPTANPFSAQTGRPYGTYIGLVADGFYGIHDFDDDGNLAAGLPVPAFGSVQPGDIKYLDLDRNGVVDQNDVTKIGRSWVPEWNFALGALLRWKGLDVSFAFQGVAGVSAYLLDNPDQMIAFVNNGNVYPIARDAWAYYPTEGIDTRYRATYPRLTTQGNPNNYRLSSQWVKDASYLKLRNVEIGYTFTGKRLDKAGISGFRCFVNGQNLLTISPLTFIYGLDPENLTGRYPQLRTFNAGVSMTF